MAVLQSLFVNVLCGLKVGVLVDAPTDHCEHRVPYACAESGVEEEFDEVIVPFVTDKDYRTEIDRSMLYVACTRAMHKLYISASGNISTFLS